MIDKSTTPLRVLFCIGVTQDFFSARADERAEVARVLPDAFGGLGERFGLTVLGTMDDDQLMVGASAAYPWTSYILADAPDLTAVARVCSIIRDAPVGEHQLWRYLRIEARVGRELFFGNE
ncbi:hypothetical protein [Streptomyces sp. NPDC059063]|uniref:hypothetical protein n=1 Tax=unclassified Streptomyces TaxID=2593676 RepID=UPI003682BD05